MTEEENKPEPRKERFFKVTLKRRTDPRLEKFKTNEQSESIALDRALEEGRFIYKCQNEDLEVTCLAPEEAEPTKEPVASQAPPESTSTSDAKQTEEKPASDKGKGKKKK